MDIVNTLCDGGTFADIKIGLHVTTVHFPSGEIEIFSRGDLVKITAASMAVSGVFEPVDIGGAIVYRWRRNTRT